MLILPETFVNKNRKQFWYITKVKYDNSAGFQNIILTDTPFLLYHEENNYFCKYYMRKHFNHCLVEIFNELL